MAVIGIEASCKILLNPTQWFVRNTPDKIWVPTDRHSDSYIPPLLRRGYNKRKIITKGPRGPVSLPCH